MEQRIWFYENEKKKEIKQQFLDFITKYGYCESDFSLIEIELVGNAIRDPISLLDERGPLCSGGKWRIFSIENRKPHTPVDLTKKIANSFEKQTGYDTIIG